MECHIFTFRLITIFIAIGAMFAVGPYQQVNSLPVLKRGPLPLLHVQKGNVAPINSEEHREEISHQDYKMRVLRQKPIPLLHVYLKRVTNANDDVQNNQISEHRTQLANGPTSLQDIRHELNQLVSNEGSNEQLELQTKEVAEVTVETLVVVDTTFAQQFDSEKSMNEYLSIYWNDVALRFSSIRKPKITILLVDVVSLKASDEKFMVLAGDGSVNFDKTLTNFAQWVASHKSLTAHDFAYLMTGRELTGDVAGYAYEGTICQGDGKMTYSAGIGEDIGAHYDTTGLAVHEIGHNLGSSHDGSSDSSKCSANDGNIMTPAPDLLQNPKSLYFSDCSIQSMYKNFQKDTAKCLLKKSAPKSKFPTSHKLPGGLQGVLDKYCEMYVTGMDVFKFVPQGDCKKVRCTAEGYEDSERKLLAPDGAPCQGSKKCIFGQCS